MEAGSVLASFGQGEEPKLLVFRFEFEDSFVSTVFLGCDPELPCKLREKFPGHLHVFFVITSPGDVYSFSLFTDVHPISKREMTSQFDISAVPVPTQNCLDDQRILCGDAQGGLGHWETGTLQDR